MTTYLITGSSRGIGLTLVSILARKEASEVGKVFAAARTETAALKNIISDSAGRVEFIPLDVISEEAAKEAAERVGQSLGGKGIDVLINNAGILSRTEGGAPNMTDLMETLNVNVFGTHNATRAFLPLLKKGELKKVINISSSIGSMTLSGTLGKFQPSPAYRVSKAAVNMLTVQYAESLEDDGFTFVALCPGWVKTDMGGERGHLTPEQSVNGVLRILSRITPADNGKYMVVDVPDFELDGQKMYDGSVRPF
ncbi:short-chain dehydrogenase/reductase SDR [Stemphylium lycopersici]|nr:short-chain dehydrogenase/reductase SDR [Stemphylium lycopersici]